MMYTKDTTLRQKDCKSGCTGHPFIGRQIPKMLCGRRMPDQSGVRGMHTLRTFSAADLYAAPGCRAAPELLRFCRMNHVPPKWQRRDEINSRLGAPLSFFFVS